MASRSLAFQFVCIVFLLVSITNGRAQPTVFELTKYGGVADGKTDNSKAFTDAWNQACQNNGGGGVVLIPSGTYLMGPVLFDGQACKGRMEVRIQGNLVAPDGLYSPNKEVHWIHLRYVTNLLITGGGSIDGKGPTAWKHNDCKSNSNCPRLPTSLRLDFIKKSVIEDIKSIDSKNIHINLFACEDLTLRNIELSAPADSPNTDGIHIGGSQDIRILNTEIGTGDDCISFSPGTQRVNISGVHCGPGHGISIGSLGTGVDENVTFVDIRNATFVGTDNGVRIKTWSPSKPGLVSHITVTDVTVDNVQNPVIIDQQYCPSRRCSGPPSSQVQVEDMSFNNIRGTSTTLEVVTLKCSQIAPCRRIEMTDIDLTYKGTSQGTAVSACSNVKVKVGGKQNPLACTTEVKLGK